MLPNCDGCGKKVDVCICSVSIGPDGYVKMPPTKLADELRQIAHEAPFKEMKMKGKILYSKIVGEARVSADKGLTFVNIPDYEFGFTVEEAKIAILLLEEQGFKCVMNKNINSKSVFEMSIQVSWA